MQPSIHDSASPQPTAFAPDDEATYRTISVLSIVGLMLGIAAPLAFFAPLLYAIPIVGIAVALFAVRTISQSDGALIGRKAAVIGLALSVASLSAAFARTAMFEEMLSRQARVAALEWIGVLQSGDAETAYQLTSSSRQGPPRDADGHPDNASTISPLDAFRANPVAHFLLDHAKGAPVTFVKDTVFDPATPGSERIQQLYRVGVPSETRDAAASIVEVMLMRAPGPSGTPAQWLIAGYKSDDVSSDPEAHDHAGHSH